MNLRRISSRGRQLSGFVTCAEKMSDSGSDAGPGGEGEWDDWNEEFMAVTKSVVHASRARCLEPMPWRNAHLSLITTASVADQVAELKERRC